MTVLEVPFLAFLVNLLFCFAKVDLIHTRLFSALSAHMDCSIQWLGA